MVAAAGDKAKTSKNCTKGLHMSPFAIIIAQDCSHGLWEASGMPPGYQNRSQKSWGAPGPRVPYGSAGLARRASYTGFPPLPAIFLLQSVPLRADYPISHVPTCIAFALLTASRLSSILRAD